MPRLSLVLLIAAAMATTALAEGDMPEDVETVRPIAGRPPVLKAGTETGLWLLVQQSGTIAGSKYTIPGKVATLSYQRHLNSFRYPIPRQFTSGSGGTSGTGAGLGAGMGTGYGSGSTAGR